MNDYLYYDKLNQWEIELLEEASQKLNSYGISKIDVDILRFPFCTSQRCKQIKNNKDTKYYAVIGDSILDTMFFLHIHDNEKNYSTKGDLDNLRQFCLSNNRLIEIMKNTGLDEYVLFGKGESFSESAYATAFESLIFSIHFVDGFNGVNNFLKNINFYDLNFITE